MRAGSFSSADYRGLSSALIFPFQLSYFGKFRLCILLLLLSPALALFAQNKEIEKANELFNSNRYNEAAQIFEETLSLMDSEGKVGRTGFAIKAKLAFCYRMNNKMQQAEKLYAEVVKDERAKAESYFYYGEALMSNGKYDEAKNWFREYKVLEPDDERADLMIQSCLMVPFLEPYFFNVEIEPFPFNSEADDNAPVLVDGGVLFSSDRKQGMKIMKERSGWTGRDYLDLYFSETDGKGGYLPPQTFSSKLNATNKNTGNATVSADGKEIYFTRNDNELNKQNTYSLQIYQAESAGKNRWKKVTKLPFCTPSFNFMHPAVSPNGKLLFFVSNKSGSIGGTDLWVSRRQANGWGRPENLGPKVNTAANEGFPFFDELGRLFFCSKGHVGFGGFDIFVTEQDANGEWQTPRNLGQPFNSSLDDISVYIDKSGKAGFFTSSRDGGDDDIFQFRVLDPAPEKAVTQVDVLPEKQVKKIKVLETETPIISVSVAEDSTAILTSVPTAPAIPQGSEVPKPPISKIRVVENSESEVSEIEKQSAVREIPVILVDTVINIYQPEHQAPTIIRPGLKLLEENLKAGLLKEGERYRIADVHFDANVWRITPLIKLQLDKLLVMLRAYPIAEFEIGVHTEALGTYDENLIISDLRARMVYDYFIQEGLPGSKFNYVGYGETMPLNHCVDNVPCTIAEHLYNNRLEIRIIHL